MNFKHDLFFSFVKFHKGFRLFHKENYKVHKNIHELPVIFQLAAVLGFEPPFENLRD